MSHLAPMLAFDVSIPIGRIGEAVERMRTALDERWPGQEGLYFGHIGDSNLHLIYSLADGSEATAHEAETAVYEIVKDYGGAISAEHGIGTLKRPFLELLPQRGRNRAHANTQAGTGPRRHPQPGEGYLKSCSVGVPAPALVRMAARFAAPPAHCYHCRPKRPKQVRKQQKRLDHADLQAG